MRALSLKWNSVTSVYDPKYNVKGTEIANALCGGHSRYQICEVRKRDADGFMAVDYVVRDAHTVSDAQVKDGVRPAIVGRTDDVEKAVEFCLKNDPIFVDED